VSDDLSELEAKVAATFEADQWTMEQAEPAEIEDGSAENGAVREVQMNVVPSCFCGNRPSGT
jgi:hypothetical protein